MIIIKSESEQVAMRDAGSIASAVLSAICEFIKPGVTTRQVDLYAAREMAALGGRSAFLGYKNYPCHVCLSINDEVVHGISGERRLQFGDIASVDVGVVFRGFIGDNARTVAVGGCSPAAQKLMDVTEQALNDGIAQATVGNRVADISRAIQFTVEKNGFSVVREFVGHGVGRSMHEEPQVPNYDDGKRSYQLRHGMTLAIEPMVNAGISGVRVLNDGWTVVTQDGLPSAHFEHTVLITNSGPEILTCWDRTRFTQKA